MALPCEYVAKYVIPSLRREAVRLLHDKYKLSNREIAKKLNLTEAAVSQYLSGKRGKKFKLSGEVMLKIRSSVERIVLNKSTIDKELCMICEEIKRDILI